MEIDEKTQQSDDVSGQANRIQRRNSKEPGFESLGYHVALSLRSSSTGWPQIFESQRDQKINSRKNLSANEREDEDVGRSEDGQALKCEGITPGDLAPMSKNSDSTVPLLRKDGHENVASRRSPLNTDERELEAGREVTVDADELCASCPESSHLTDHPCGVENRPVGYNNPVPKDETSGSSFLQATLNGTNVLVGVGILSTPYALSQSGWLSMVFLLGFSAICLYTGILLRKCLDVHAAIITYPDIGQAAFGWKGKLLVSFLLYLELYCVTVEYLILEGDNLASLFPISGATIGNCSFTQQQVYIVLSALCMLPTVWLRNLSLLAYISAGGVMASLAVVAAVGYVGVVDGIGFHHSGTLLRGSGLPVAVGVYAFCFCGHAVFPNIYTSMKHRKDFSKVLAVCFALVTVIYAGIGALGYTMFGAEVESQVTLNLPNHLLSSRIAIWITLVNPFAKFALTLTPLAEALEACLPWTRKSRQFFVWGNVIRTVLVVSLIAIAVLVPFFGYIMALIGSFMSISVSVILPCLCYLRIFSRRSGVSAREYFVLIAILILGLVAAFVGTFSALKGIIGSLDHIPLRQTSR